MSAPGIDALLAAPGRYLHGPRVALLGNQASVTGSGRPTLEALRDAAGIELAALLTPEHGWSGFEDDATPIGDRRDARTGLAQHSLYGPRRRPDAAALRGLDAVVIDLQEVGVRCYTYAATAALVCEAAAEAGTRVVLCDRPGLLGARVTGPALDPARRSFLGYLDVPYQHGSTIGEVVTWAVRGLGVDLVVAPCGPGGGSGLGFVPPSPGLPTPESVALYPGLVLLEGTNLSEGRGTTLPFQLLGAPWLDGYALAEELEALALPGVRFRPLTFLPRTDRHAGAVCHGVQLHVVDAGALQAFEAVIAVLRVVAANHPEFRWTSAADKPWAALPGAGEPWHEPVAGALVDSIVGDDSVRRVVAGELALEAAQAEWAAVAAAWREQVPARAASAS